MAADTCSNNDCVHVITMQIFVAGNYGEMLQHPVDAVPSDTIYKIKTRLQDKVGIPRDKLQLYFEDKQLENKKRLKDYSTIDSGAVLYYSKKGAGKLTIFVKKVFPRNKTIAIIRAKPDYTILEVKHRIEKKRGFPLDQQDLWFSERELEYNDVTLRDYDIEEGSTILLHLKNDPMEIFVNWSMGKTCAFRVTPNTAVLSLKIGIQNMINVPLDKQTLIFRGTQLEDERTFRDYEIKKGNILTLNDGAMCISVQVSIVDDKRKSGDVEFIVKPDTTIRSIQMAIEKKFGIPLGDQRLFFYNDRISDYTIEYHEIKHGDVLFMMKTQSGMISSFTSKNLDDPLTQWLMLNDTEREEVAAVRTTMTSSSSSSLCSYPTRDQLFATVKKTNASMTESSFMISHNNNSSQAIISVVERKRLMEFLDAATHFFAPESKDIKITLGDNNGQGGSDALSALLLLFGDDQEVVDGIPNCGVGTVGEQQQQKYRALLNMHEYSSDAKIALRRTEGPVEGCIGFHCDNSAKHTIQIALNDDNEYDGGKLCFVTTTPATEESSSFSSSSSTITTSTTRGTPSLKLTVPKRYAGTITGHKFNVLHAVTKLHRGVRYSLFVVDRKNGLGEKDVHCVDSNTVHCILNNSNSKTSAVPAFNSNDRKKAEGNYIGLDDETTTVTEDIDAVIT